MLEKINEPISKEIRAACRIIDETYRLGDLIELTPIKVLKIARDHLKKEIERRKKEKPEQIKDNEFYLIQQVVKVLQKEIDTVNSGAKDIEDTSDLDWRY